MPKEFQAWEDSSGVTYAPTENIAKLLEQGVIEPGAVHVFSYQAKTYIEAMQAYYDFYEFGKYNPLLDEEGNPVDTVFE